MSHLNIFKVTSTSLGLAGIALTVISPAFHLTSFLGGCLLGYLALLLIEDVL